MCDDRTTPPEAPPAEQTGFLRLKISGKATDTRAPLMGYDLRITDLESGKDLQCYNGFSLVLREWGDPVVARIDVLIDEVEIEGQHAVSLRTLDQIAAGPHRYETPTTPEWEADHAAQNDLERARRDVEHALEQLMFAQRRAVAGNPLLFRALLNVAESNEAAP